MVALKVCLHAPKHATSAVNQHRQGPMCSLFPFLFIFFLLSFSLPPLFLSFRHILIMNWEENQRVHPAHQHNSVCPVTHWFCIVCMCVHLSVCACLKEAKCLWHNWSFSQVVIYFLWLSWQQETGRDAGCWRSVSVCVFVRLCVSESRDHPLHHKQHQMH